MEELQEIIRQTEDSKKDRARKIKGIERSLGARRFKKTRKKNRAARKRNRAG